MGVKPSIFADPNAAFRQARQLVASDPAAATKQARQLLQSSPEDPALLRLLAAGLRKLGKTEEAEQAEKQAIQATTRSPAHREAARAIAAGDKKQAAAILEALIARDDTDVVALVMLGLQMSLENEHEIAEPLLRKAVETAPGDVAARNALAESLLRARKPAEALKIADGFDADAAKSPGVLALRAQILRDLGRQEEEVAILEELASTQARPENYFIRLGHAYRNLGRTDDAIRSYRKVFETAPYEGTSWWSLANLKTVKFDDGDIATMEKALAIPGLPELNRVRLHFALGKAHEDRKEVEPSIRHYLEANRLRSATVSYQPEQVSDWIDKAEATYTPEFFSSREKDACQASDPIFVVGMQRSGSTLVEQILDSHPQIEGTAELTEFPALARQLGETAHRRGVSTNEHVRRLRGEDVMAIGQAYIDRTRTYRVTDKPHFTDKMPNNWLYSGLIRLFLPNAKIVDVRRHPLDCCFSNWKQLYGKGLEHSYSMDHMGRYYADYVRLMRLMDRVQPGKIHRVIYERLVDDTEGEVRRLLDYLGLPFDEACLSFHSNERSVRTISAEQVRQPINRRGLNQWKPYEKWLDPLKEALGPTLDDWDQ